MTELIQAMLLNGVDVAKAIWINNNNDLYVYMKNWFPSKYHARIIELAEMQKQKIEKAIADVDL